ncbi:MurB family protein [Agromyces rhizosphaerae]|uniref:MurB family protein n=1 Tax=Agromyces rhizosphaerae TaxID=88374 RepID=A0A9W6FRQ3_9MICO|nr:polysaccharide pyruvyl transferase family protein [Agromyces rhizosphaerae]GLI27348.1 MurB family protein [Agromyces rhizosphaerae]
MTRRVLIKTLPLHTNYGGILQAYALQRVIRELGFDVVTDTTVTMPWRRRMRWRYFAVRRALRMLLPLRVDWSWRARHQVMAAQARFAARHLRRVRRVERASTPRAGAELARRFDTFLVGSDQVWRAYYADVPEYLFGMLPATPGGPRRVSYAASFGVEDVGEYRGTTLERARELIRRFDAVSVRERSGVRICRDAFGIDAEQHVDPTMLLDADAYRALAKGADAAEPEGSALLVFRLDEHDALDGVEAAVADRLGLEPRSLLPSPPPPTYREYAADPTRYDLPTVEAWLAGFAAAGFVVTDSFHGCVFAILFNRPFLAVANARRGRARFESLLELFDLGHHLVDPGAGAVDERVFAPDWAAVNRILDAERARAREYLARVL